MMFCDSLLLSSVLLLQGAEVSDRKVDLNDVQTVCLACLGAAACPLTVKNILFAFPWKYLLDTESL